LNNEQETIPELEPLLQLARAHLSDAPPRRDTAGLANVRSRLTRRRPNRSRGGELRFMAAAFVAAAMAFGFYFSRQGAAPLEMEVLAGELSSIGEVRPSTEATTIRFSDGTRVEVEPAARARVTAVNASGADVQLDHGQISLDVAKRPGASWNVLAGAYRVHVTGTSFAVAFDDARRTLGVRMFAGSVRVTGPLLGEGRDVRRGERLLVDFEHGRVSVDPVDADADEAVAPELDPGAEAAPLDEVSSSPETNADLEPSRPPQRGRPRVAAAPSWQSRVASGEFAAVLKQAEQRGLQNVYQVAALDDLDALADAARYARRTGVARDALLAIRGRFASSRMAKEAAFLMGRLLEASDAPVASALEWYQRYLDEDARGVYAAQALGRKMLIVHRQHGADQALPIAKDYLKRFPEGPHASSARKLVAGR